MMSKRQYGIALATALAVSIASPAAFAAVTATADLVVAGALAGSARIDACSNHPGPFITLEGELAFGGINGRLIFRNNVKGTHTHVEEVSADVSLLPPGASISIPKQPPLGGAGGNPHIYLQLFDGDWQPISARVSLGRCVQGIVAVDLGALIPATAEVDASAADCDNSPGPFITLSGGLIVGGINGRVTFQNNRKGTHSATEDVSVDFVILAPGEEISFPKQPPLGGVGGNPRISFQFTDDAGDPLSGEIFLGRCVQLGR